MKKIIQGLLVKLALFFFNKIYDYIDKNDDMKLDKEELKEFYEEMLKKLEAIKNKIKK